MHIWTTADILEIEQKHPRCLALDAMLNTDALKASLCTVTGATECVELSKLAEGGFHRILVARMNNDREVIARVSYNSEKLLEGSMIMESEIATIQWIGSNTDIPVPRILFSCPEPKNPVGAPYMIMERIPGRALSRLWDTMTETQKDQVVAKLAQVTATLMKSCRFDKIGSLYPDGDTVSIGPMLPYFSPWFFRKDLSLDRGPWSSEREYLLACARREIEWISTNQDELVNEWNPEGDSGLGKEDLVAGYTAVLRKLEDHITATEDLDIRFEDYGPFVLRHIDFNTMNVMVREDDPTVITGVIDWDGANTAPLWALTQVPDFLRDLGDENEPDAVDRASRARLRDVYLKAASEAFPTIFEGAAQVAKAGSLARLENIAAAITTSLELKTMKNLAASILDKSVEMNPGTTEHERQ